MSKRESLKRYHLIIQKLRKRPATFDEIEDYLELESEIQAYDFSISKRTFQRDVNDIASLYNIEIKYDFSRKVYFIDSDNQSEFQERIREAFDVYNALTLRDDLSQYIQFENRRPQGTENLYGLLHAIKNKFQIKFTYLKYWEEIPREREAEPYALKEFKNRWYVLAKDLKDGQVKSFALDRLSNPEITKRNFQFPVDFNITEHYKNSFGIISPNGERLQDVILSFTQFQGKYIKSLPLHESQIILVDNKNELRIRLRVFVTHDLVMELLSYGANLKVIEPQSLVDEMKKVYSQALELYEK